MGQAAGGIITLEDLANYRVQWEEPTTHKLKNLGYTLISSPPPGSGAILSSILGVMDAYQPTPMDRHSAKAWHRFIEATKFGYAKRTEMGDWNQDHHCRRSSALQGILPWTNDQG